MKNTYIRDCISSNMATHTIADGKRAFTKWISGAKLDSKSHQLEGIEWLLKRERSVNRLDDRLDDSKTVKQLKEKWGSTSGSTSIGACIGGGILADEMGLGKTILMLGLIISHYQTRTLIVVPPAILKQWETEIIRLIGHHPLIYHGTKAKHLTADDIARVPLVLTTYGMLSPRSINGSVSPCPLAQIAWSRAIYDEAHHLRNHKTHKYKGARSIHSRITWLVTGTPIQNKIKDMYSLCSILANRTVKKCDKHIMDDVVDELLLRRTKARVGIKMPPLVSTTVTVPWKGDEEELLAENLHSRWGFANVNKRSIGSITGSLASSKLPAMLRMKQVCILPSLLEHRVRLLASGDDSDIVVRRGTAGESKLQAVLNTLIGRRENERSKIVFCHFRGEIDWLRSHLKQNGVRTMHVDGRTPLFLRECILNSTHCDVILLQIQTACEGLNLQHFKEIYFPSPHWNPCVEEQAVARSYRIGQSEQVDVFRFIMDDFSDGITMDRHCKTVQDVKRDLIASTYEGP